MEKKKSKQLREVQWVIGLYTATTNIPEPCVRGKGGGRRAPEDHNTALYDDP